jgi:hypothetical protein
MNSQMLQKMLCKIAGTLESCRIPYSIAGAFALKLYGIRRFAMDLEFIADVRDREEITAGLEKANFHCCYRTDVYSRFESDNDICGRVECMFIRTRYGREMIDRKRYAADATMGAVPVVTPTDYVLLKLMSMANQPEGSFEDETDIRSILELYNRDQIPSWCGSFDKERVHSFAVKHGQESVVEKLFSEVFEPSSSNEIFVL